MLLFVIFLHITSVSSLNITNIIFSIDKLMNYYEVGYDKMNIDGIYGLRLLEGKGPFTHSTYVY